MKIGIVGLPNVGKSTLFNAITNAGVQSENYPFCTVDPNIGVVAVPDHRIEQLEKMYSPKKVSYATIEFVDIAGLVKGASKGEGLGNKFLAHIREVDAIVHVVRCFENQNIIHVDGNVDPKRDLETINLELIFSDMEVVQRRIAKTQKLLKADKRYENELAFWQKVLDTLEKGMPLRNLDCSKEEKLLLENGSFLTYKPIIYVANLSESDFSNGADNNSHYKNLKEIVDKENAMVIPICIELESEISEMSENEKLSFLKDIGIKESGLDNLIKASYKLLNLISYLTAGKPEVKAWTIENGTKAPQAAGKIHSDFERGFICAEVISYNDLIECGSMSHAKEKGLVRSEGKEYVVKDGDVILFRFNVSK